MNQLSTHIMSANKNNLLQFGSTVVNVTVRTQGMHVFYESPVFPIESNMKQQITN